MVQSSTWYQLLSHICFVKVSQAWRETTFVCSGLTRLVRAGYSRHGSGASRERARITRRAQDGSVHMQCSLPSSSYPARSTLMTEKDNYVCTSEIFSCQLSEVNILYWHEDLFHNHMNLQYRWTSFRRLKMIFEDSNRKMTLFFKRETCPQLYVPVSKFCFRDCDLDGISSFLERLNQEECFLKIKIKTFRSTPLLQVLIRAKRLLTQWNRVIKHICIMLYQPHQRSKFGNKQERRMCELK